MAESRNVCVTGLTCLAVLWCETEHECKHTFRRRNMTYLHQLLKNKEMLEAQLNQV